MPALQVVVPQSEANSPDRASLESLLGSLAGLTRLECRYRFSGGYSACRVYLALADFQGVTQPRPWIVKIGPSEEIRAEDNAWILAKANIPPEVVAAKVATQSDGTTGVLIYDFAHYEGRTPVDLAAVLGRVEAVEALGALVDRVQKWSAQSVATKNSNVTQVVKSWSEKKLDRLPPWIDLSRDAPTLYSPDFGVAYANPAYFLRRNMKGRDVKTPFAFTHGDLNLRNVLFRRKSDSSIDAQNPIVIDCRHASQDQYAILDLAKLEACIVYENIDAPDSLDSLRQSTAFLAALKASFQETVLPDSCTDKRIQDRFRCVQKIRTAASALLGPTASQPESDATLPYWGAVLSYAISAATYSQLSDEARTMAYLDAAAIFTRFFQELVPGYQFVLPIHRLHSPPVMTAHPAPPRPFERAMLASAISNSRSILVVGPGYGRQDGVEPLLASLTRVYKSVTGEEAPPLSANILLESLNQRAPRQSILRALREKAKMWSDQRDRSFVQVPWAAVVNWHFHSLPYEAMTSAASSGGVARVESPDDIAEKMDDIAGGNQAYLPLMGDVESVPGNLVLTNADRRLRRETISLLARAFEQRQRAFAVVFWKCEDLPIDDVLEIRHALSDELTVNVDSYYVSQLDDNTRDVALQTLGVARVNATLEDLKTEAGTIATSSSRWDSDEVWEGEKNERIRLPNLPRLTNGILRWANDHYAAEPRRPPEAFLLGGAPTYADIAAGRVIKRATLDASIVPALRSAHGEKDRLARVVVLLGRAGAGVSTLLCHAAYLVEKMRLGPVVSADLRFARGANELREWGGVLAEVSKLTGTTVTLVAECNDRLLDGLTQLLDGCVTKGGRLAVLIGGRRDNLLREIPHAAMRLAFNRIDVGDTLQNFEWSALARVLKKNGFSTAIETEVLAEKMRAVGRLLPALFEATDRQNRKFQEIVAYEYSRYSRDAIVQRAYRYICTLGAFDVSISQYWMLRTLGDRGIADAARILAALSDDIVTQRDSEEGDDVTVSPVHRLIAEEVVAHATPEPIDRLNDIQRLVECANLASRKQGMSVAALLYRSGPLMTWLRAALSSEAQRQELAGRLYKAALQNKPISAQVEIHLRQHYALSLRSWQMLEDALAQITAAEQIEPENSATQHILGLVHETRALRAWGSLVDGDMASALGKAAAYEQEALMYFRSVRDARPFQEHGYESEARYYRKKYDLLRTAHVHMERIEDSRLQLFFGLDLLRSAEAKVPTKLLKESPKTRALLLRSTGDLEGAYREMIAAAAASEDSVRRRRLQRAAMAIAMERQCWQDARVLCEELVASGDRDAALYLQYDAALAELRVPARERASVFRESAEEYNRWDVETQVRWAELSLAAGHNDRAVDALRRADEVASEAFDIQERERVRGVVATDGHDRRFAGVVRRMARADEGFVSVPGFTQLVFFRVEPSLRGNVGVDDTIEFRLAWRIRGMRAIDVSVKARKKPGRDPGRNSSART